MALHQRRASLLSILQLYSADTCPPVPDEIQLSPLAEDFRLKCFAMYVSRFNVRSTLLLTPKINSKPEERPTAAVLRNHAYLELPMFWSFSGDFKS